MTAPERACLLIAYYYPPGGGVGVMRALKFSTYLPAFGWRPVVLTAVSPLGIPLDPSLAIPNGATVHRVAPTIAFPAALEADRSWPTRLLSAALLIPDPFVGWLPAALRRGLEVVRRERPRVIVATSPPNSSQLLGWALSRLTGLPLVADFRDAWLTDPDRNRALHNRLRIATVERVMEAMAVGRAARVVSVSDAILDDFRRRYPRKPADAFALIENGFDEAEVEGVVPARLDGFAIVLTGSMDKPHRSAEPLLRAVAALFEGAPQLRALVRVHLVGTAAPSDRDLAHRLGLAPNVAFAGWVSHGQALAYQRGASVNVMVWGGPGDARRDQMMSSKLFEYLAARRPIVAAIPATSAAARMLGRVRGTRIVAPLDVDSLAAALGDLALGRGAAPGPMDADLAPFTRRGQAGRLASLLSAVARS